jgi:long-chain-fatty-acyl-CoA reductase
MSETMKLPFIICGEKVEPGEKTVTLNFENDFSVCLPDIGDELVSEKINDIFNDSYLKQLHDLPTDEIILFYSKVGTLWCNPEYSWRKKMIEYSSRVTGFDRCIIERDIEIFAHYIENRAQQYDQLEAELGSRFILDEWISKFDILLHAQPKGRVLHILVGNIPMASMFSIYRASLVKNQTIAKLPSRDVFTTLFFVLSFFDVDPNHPVTKSMSVLYWQRDNKACDRIYDRMDAICAWGREDAINAIRSKCRYGTDIIEFGPKKSLSVVDIAKDMDKSKIENAAMKVAHDASVYNQEACFNSQQLIVRCDDNQFEFLIDKIKEWMNQYLDIFPKGFTSFDVHADCSIKIMEEQFNGSSVIFSENNNWAIIINNKDHVIYNHPLNRTLYIFRIESLAQVEDFVDKNVQTVGVFPWDLSYKIRDRITEKGAKRVCEIGCNNFPRAGWTHDGMYAMRRLVELVSVERPIVYKGKYQILEPAQLDEIVYKKGFKSLHFLENETFVAELRRCTHEPI